jgi:hypothetical protein
MGELSLIPYGSTDQSRARSCSKAVESTPFMVILNWTGLLK